MKKLNELLSYEVKQDTRDQKDLNVYVLNEKVSKDEYIRINQTMKESGCYYSKFVKGFICKVKLNLDDLQVNEDVQIKPQKNNSSKVEYHKNVLDYISLEEYKNFLINVFAEDRFRYSWYFNNQRYATNEERINAYKKELLDNLQSNIDYGCFGDLKYIREAIIHKSLGLTIDEFDCNGSSAYYMAIWDKLPIIEGLKLTNESYSSMWGYDQTNVDIAYKINKKLWGLDAFKITTCKGQYMLVRMKNDQFHDKVRYFSKDSTPEKTFQHDANQTGQYR